VSGSYLLRKRLIMYANESIPFSKMTLCIPVVADKSIVKLFVILLFPQMGSFFG